MNNRAKAPKQSRRFSDSFNEDDYRAIAQSLTESANRYGGAYTRLRDRVKGKLLARDLAGTVPEVAE